MKRALFLSSILTVFSCTVLSAQLETLPQAGIAAYTDYQHSDIDSVNLETGNVNVHVPLVSFPQLGDKLRLNFILRYNQTDWTVAGTPTLVGNGTTLEGTLSWTLQNSLYPSRPVGVDVVRDQGVTEITSSITFECYDNTYAAVLNGQEQALNCDGSAQPPVSQTSTSATYIDLIDRTGAEHPVGMWGSVPTSNIFSEYFLTPDGSGWLPQFSGNTGNPLFYKPSVVPTEPTDYLDRDGVRYVPKLIGSGATAREAFDLHDTHGNSIVTTAAGWTDSVGRNIPGSWSGPGSGYGNNGPSEDDPIPGVVSTDTSGCTTPPTAVRLWQVPSYNGETSTYKLCYNDFTSSTHFGVTSMGGYPGGPNEASGTAAVRLLTQVILPNTTSYIFTYDPAYLELTGITFPSGGSVTYTWTTISWQPCSFTLPVKRAVATRAISSINGGPVQTWSYQWKSSNGCIYGSNLLGGLDVIVTKPDGNDEVHSTSPTADSVMYYQGKAPGDTLSNQPAGTLLRSEASQKSSFYGPLFAPDILPPVGHTSATQPSSYQEGFPGPTVSTVVTLDDKSVSQTLSTPVPSGGPIPSFNTGANTPGLVAAGTCQCLNYGLTSAVAEYDYGQAGSGSAGPLLRTTTTKYKWMDGSANAAAYEASALLDLPSSVVVTDGSGNKASETDYTYDEGVTGATVQGLPTTITQYVNASSTIASHTSYSAQGMPVLKTDPNGNKTNTTYDSTNLYPKQVTTAYQNSTTTPENNSYQFDFNTGKVTSHTDPNGKTTTYSYNDPLTRLTNIAYPDGGSFGVSYDDAITPSVTLTTATGEATGPIVQNVLYDGLGRMRQTQLTSDPSGIDTVDTTYDSMGRVASTSNPYRSTNDSTYGLTSYAYDALGRKTLQCQPDNGTGANPCVAGSSYLQWSYIGNAITHTDEVGNQWRYINDGIGRTTAALELYPGTPVHCPPPGVVGPCTPAHPVLPFTAETDYTYDALNNLTNVNQQGLVRSFSYDSLSRLITSSNPETGTICYGTWSGGSVGSGTCQNGYDANGNLAHKTDARNITTSYSYDSLNRLTGKSYSDGVTPTAAFTYDQMTDTYGNATGSGIGRLTSESTGSGTAAWSAAYHYDPMGRIAQKRQLWGAHPSWAPYMFYQYDLAGNPTMKDNGESRRFYFTYDTAGRAIKMTTGPANGTIDGTLVSDVTYLPVGEYFTELGNGAEVRHFYDNRMRMNGYRFAPSPSDYTYLDAWNVTYDKNGNVIGAGDLYVQGVWTYTYDNLNRLTTASNTWGPACQYSYDIYGNRTSQAPYQSGTCLSSTLSYTGNRITTPGYQYDAAGNLISDGVTAYGYDAESRLISVHNSTTTATYQYDPEGNRISSTVNGVYKNFGYDQDGHLAWTNYGSGTPMDIYFNGRHFGYLYTNSDQSVNRVIYSSIDHLGTEQVRVDGNQNIVGKYNHLPFGDGQTIFLGTDDDTLHFTGKERDTESGLDYFGARYYASSMGRFMSPDWTAKEEGSDPVPYADLTDPQSLNLYSYVKNNPLSHVDKDGHCFWDLCIGEGALIYAGGAALTAAYLTTPSGQQALHAGTQLLQMGANALSNVFHSSDSNNSDTSTPAPSPTNPAAAPSSQQAPATAPGFVGDAGGNVVQIPSGSTVRPADNGNGLVYQPPVAPGQHPDADAVRVMGPHAHQPTGSIVVHGPDGRPINPATGKTDTRANTHTPIVPSPPQPPQKPQTP